MKKVLNLFAVAAFSAFIFTSCDGGNTAETTETTETETTEIGTEPSDEIITVEDTTVNDGVADQVDTTVAQ